MHSLSIHYQTLIHLHLPFLASFLTVLEPLLGGCRVRRHTSLLYYYPKLNRYETPNQAAVSFPPGSDDRYDRNVASARSPPSRGYCTTTAKPPPLGLADLALEECLDCLGYGRSV
jgi:hypothetical protein